MKISLQLNGREMTFSEEELIAILEKHFKSKTTEKKTSPAIEVANVPTEGKCFIVNPLEINMNLFKKERHDPKQECIRKLIEEAFDEVKKNPVRYGKPFKTMIPPKTWSGKTVGELRDLASNLGDHMTDWIEQALEWAQRISNGEPWEALCNDLDTARWYRLVKWKYGGYRLVGGAKESLFNFPASYVQNNNMCENNRLNTTVPSVVFYK